MSYNAALRSEPSALLLLYKKWKNQLKNDYQCGGQRISRSISYKDNEEASVMTEEKKKFTKIHLEPKNQLFAEVMANGKKYIIPRFQRDYSWSHDHWAELWQDIGQMQESKIQHFMGYLVFQTQDEKTFEIIDGQQRLTTLAIVVLAALSKTQQLIDAKVEPEKNQQRDRELSENLYRCF